MAKYNTKIVKELCSYIEQGLSQKESARLAGISESTFYEWASKPELSESVEVAGIKYKQRLLEAVNISIPNDGKLALEILGRKWPNEFGKRDNIPVPKEEPHEKMMTEETALALIRMYEEHERLEQMRASK